MFRGLTFWTHCIQCRQKYYHYVRVIDNNYYGKTNGISCGCKCTVHHFITFHMPSASVSTVVYTDIMVLYKSLLAL